MSVLHKRIGSKREENTRAHDESSSTYMMTTVGTRFVERREEDNLISYSGYSVNKY